MVIIRTALPDDAIDIQNVFYKTWLETYPSKAEGIITEDIQEIFKDNFSDKKIEELKNRLKDFPSNAKMLVAFDEENTKVVGLCRIYLREKFNQLQAIYILPEYQRSGIGRKLWAEALNFFNKDKNIIVQVATYNKKAISFYESLGFVDTGKRFTEERHRMPVSKKLIPEMEMKKNTQPRLDCVFGFCRSCSS